MRLKANNVHMVWIDGKYEMVAVQEKLKYGRTSGIDFGPIDYIKYAQASGATGLMIDNRDDIAPVAYVDLDQFWIGRMRLSFLVLR